MKQKDLIIICNNSIKDLEFKIKCFEEGHVQSAERMVFYIKNKAQLTTWKEVLRLIGEEE